MMKLELGVSSNRGREREVLEWYSGVRKGRLRLEPALSLTHPLSQQSVLLPMNFAHTVELFSPISISCGLIPWHNGLLE